MPPASGALVIALAVAHSQTAEVEGGGGGSRKLLGEFTPIDGLRNPQHGRKRGNGGRRLAVVEVANQLFVLGNPTIVRQGPFVIDWEGCLSVPGMRDSIKKGMAEPLSKSAKRLNW